MICVDFGDGAKLFGETLTLPGFRYFKSDRLNWAAMWERFNLELCMMFTSGFRQCSGAWFILATNLNPELFSELSSNKWEKYILWVEACDSLDLLHF